MIPRTYEQWHHCITVKCDIELYREFVHERLAVYVDADNEETKRFVALYGQNHLKNIIQWYSQALK